MRKYFMRLSLVGLIILSILLVSCSGSITGNVIGHKTDMHISKTITPLETEELIAENTGNEDFTIIDVRTPQEFMKGHLNGATLINYYDSTFSDQLEKLDKEQTYLIYCRTGLRSESTLQMMKNMKFTKVYSLEGGIIAWQATGHKIN